MKLTDYVSPFQGNGEVCLPALSHPASSWRFIKGLSGNTTPAACLPFGKYSVCAYDGAYPTGYGVNQVNCGEKVRKLYDRPKCIGLAHFQVSGTGAIGYYYNYALCSPFIGSFPDWEARDILYEEAHPGYYAAETDTGFMEATVSKSCVLHRYRLTGEGGIAVDFANNNLYNSRKKVTGCVEVPDEKTLLADMLLEGVEVHFAIRITGGRVTTLFREGESLKKKELTVGDSSEAIRFGGIIECGKEVELRLAVSFKSRKHALILLNTETRDFDEVRADADRIWEKALGRIEIETDDRAEKEIFYSNLYHTLIKPMDFSGEAFLFENPEGDFACDIATMWDIYKTQLPLLYTLYPEISEKLLETLRRFGEAYGRYPHCLILAGNTDIESKQARMLAEYTVCDAFYRGIRADYESLYRLSLKDAARFKDYFEDRCAFASHTLDMAEALTALSDLARALGHPEDAERLANQEEHLRSAFGPDGLMRTDSDYYEGSRYNYSFRPVRNPGARFGFAGEDGKKKLQKEALRFFGFTDPESIPPVNPAEGAPSPTAFFEGFNNETDMEAPCFLHDLGLREELCRVIKTGMDGMFTRGRGGIPGNADSGGLTAAYIWNVLGIFPVSGQNRMIIGTPRYKKAILHLAGHDLTVIREGEGIYPEKAFLNGKYLENFEFTAAEMMQGGKLIIQNRPEGSKIFTE